VKRAGDLAHAASIARAACLSELRRSGFIHRWKNLGLFERNWDDAFFSIYLALSTSDQVGIKRENQQGIGVNETLYH
jgi:hypothetical protein